MIRRSLVAASAALLLATAGCSGMRQTENGHFTVHAESFRIFGIAIPGDDQAAAEKLVMDKFPGATVHTQYSTPADWTSFWGVLGNIIGFHGTSISGVKG